MNGLKTSRKGGAATLTTSNSDQATSIDMKGAVQSAMVFTKDLLPEAKDIRLEEVEPISGGWSVVISYATNQSATFAVLRGEEGPRAFKKITIDSKSGKAQSLKAWK
jgi:hypothetical protein